jgi:competence protein ComEA
VRGRPLEQAAPREADDLATWATSATAATADDADDADDVGATAEPPLDRSWSPAGRHAPTEPEQRWRLDLGRSAVGALLLVAALAALLAAGVVLRGRPQEVAAPVVDGRATVSAPSSGAAAGAVPAVEASGVPLPGSSPRTPAAAPGEVVVAVAGKVRTPGLVRLPAGSRVDDALRAAGGPVDPAAVGLLNLARVLVDGEQVLVGVEPPPGAAAPVGGGGGPGAPAAGGGLLDLNAASASDLDGLPGIGPVLAQRIVDWRTEHGRFASVDQLREVTGIGEAKYQDLVEKVVV